MNARSLLVSGTLPLLAACCGCTVFHVNNSNYADESRMSVRYENDEAARLFESRAAAEIRASARKETNIVVPFVLTYSRKAGQSENLAYNVQVRRCDVNHDGLISQLEAEAYAAHGK